VEWVHNESSCVQVVLLPVRGCLHEIGGYGLFGIVMADSIFSLISTDIGENRWRSSLSSVNFVRYDCRFHCMIEFKIIILN